MLNAVYHEFVTKTAIEGLPVDKSENEIRKEVRDRVMGVDIKDVKLFGVDIGASYKNAKNKRRSLIKSLLLKLEQASDREIVGVYDANADDRGPSGLDSIFSMMSAFPGNLDGDSGPLMTMIAASISGPMAEFAQDHDLRKFLSSYKTEFIKFITEVLSYDKSAVDSAEEILTQAKSQNNPIEYVLSHYKEELETVKVQSLREQLLNQNIPLLPFILTWLDGLVNNKPDYSMYELMSDFFHSNPSQREVVNACLRIL